MRRKIIIERADRLHQIPPFEYAEFERRYRLSKRREVEVIDLTKISLPAELSVTPESYLKETSSLPSRSERELETQLCEKLSEVLSKTFRLRLNPAREILVVPGVRTGLVALMNSFLNPGDACLILDPSPPYHRAAVMLSGGKPEVVPVFERNDYLVNFESIEVRSAKRAKLLLLCYPHNPTGAAADMGFYREAIGLAALRNIILVNDVSFLTPQVKRKSPTLLQQTRAKSVAVELYSFEYLFGMSGWECGFVVGNREIIRGLRETIQWSAPKLPAVFYHLALSAVRDCERFQSRLSAHLERNRDMMTESLTEMGWEVRRSHEVPFLWANPPFVMKKDPSGKSSLRFSRMLLRRTGVRVLPGVVFGENGEGFVRISITPPEDKLTEALKRIREHSHLWQKRYRPRRKGGSQNGR
jgi:aspartate/methionine/tyrosine aminotransferase